MKQRALVISGGGSKGAFSVGVVKDLMHIYQVDFDILVGTSTGALIVPLVALGELEQLEALYTTVTDEQILVKYNLGSRLNTTSVFTAGPLIDKIEAIYTDAYFDKLLASKKEIYLTTTCLQTERLVVFTTAQHAPSAPFYELQQIVNADQLRRAILASASQPVFMPPVKVNKNLPGAAFPDHQFVDGGVREYAGLAIAIDAGADEIFTTIHVAKNARHSHEQLNNLFAVLQKTISIFITDVGDNDLNIPNMYNEALLYISGVKQKMRKAGVSDALIDEYFVIGQPGNRFRGKEPVKIHIIQPEENLGGGPGGLVFHPDEMKDMLLKGQLALQTFVAHLNKEDIDWA
ncbi:patatin-like phospholipase family protein [Niabella insulamsoli]|uniref:patatin-like phospholipase family protein n=1 Tax=Niabella insulamsoli TaxID=3144874 RepID=UPI0031FBC55A